MGGGGFGGQDRDRDVSSVARESAMASRWLATMIAEHSDAAPAHAPAHTPGPSPIGDPSAIK